MPCERRCTKTHIPFRGLLASQLVCKECDTKVICNGKSCCGVISTKVCLRFQCSRDFYNMWFSYSVDNICWWMVSPSTSLTLDKPELDVSVHIELFVEGSVMTDSDSNVNNSFSWLINFSKQFTKNTKQVQIACKQTQWCKHFFFIAFVNNSQVNKLESHLTESLIRLILSKLSFLNWLCCIQFSEQHRSEGVYWGRGGVTVSLTVSRLS